MAPAGAWSPALWSALPGIRPQSLKSTPRFTGSGQVGPGRGQLLGHAGWSCRRCAWVPACPLRPHAVALSARMALLLEPKVSRAKQGLYTSAQDVFEAIVCVFSQTQAYRRVARMEQELPPCPLESRLLTWCSIVPQARTLSDATQAPCPRQGRCRLVIRPHQGFLVVPTASFAVTRPSPGPHMALSLPVGPERSLAFP